MAGSGTAHLHAHDGDALLRVEHLVVEYSTSGHGHDRRLGRSGTRVVRAVSDLSLDILRGETVGLVGESGCGKSTTGYAIMMLNRPTAGRVVFQGRDLTKLTPRDLRQTRRAMHMVFQDP